MTKPGSRSQTRSSAAPLVINNSQARNLWLNVNGLGSKRGAYAPSEGHTAAMDLASNVVQRLGLIQLDPLRPVVRAHEHILWSRSNKLRPRHFERLIEQRRVFEHFSHDACVLPMQNWPYWQRQFDRRAKSMEQGSWGCALPSANIRHKILDRIEKEGALSSRDFDNAFNKPAGAWSKPPHKVALDWLWLKGKLAVTHRRGFIKHYDLVERVVPDEILKIKHEDSVQRDWLCRQALDRLGVATTGQLQRFWDALSANETSAWISEHPKNWQAVSVEGHDGSFTQCIAPSNIEQLLQEQINSSKRLRIINPFDPTVRDRKRLASLFGFDFRIEIYVPAHKRQFGYYTCPLLEGTKFIGRIELRALRDEDRLEIKGLWLEAGFKLGAGRAERLHAELLRMARLAGVSMVGDLPCVA